MKRYHLPLNLTLLALCACSAYAEPALPTAGQAEIQAFQKEMAKQFHTAEGMNQFSVKGSDHWLYPRNELRFLSTDEFWGEAAQKVSRATNPDYADPLPAILEFHRALAEKGITLILVPVPAKGAVYPEFLPGTAKQDAPFKRFDAPTLQFLNNLTEAGVDVIDLVPPFIEAKSQGQSLYCRTDSHWSSAACDITAALITEKLNSAEWYDGISKTTYVSETVNIEINGDLVEGLNGADVPKETLELKQVGTRDGENVAAIPEDENSPVLLMGDSHTLVFHDPQLLASRAGLFDHLSAQLGFPLDLLGTRGSGATNVRIDLFRRQSKAKKSGGDYLAGKKAIIWCFSAREFTETDTGWRVVPLEK